MGNKASAAVLYSVFGVAEVAAAFGSHPVKRAETEKTVETVRIIGFMTGEIFALSVCEVSVTVFHSSIL